MNLIDKENFRVLEIGSLDRNAIILNDFIINCTLCTLCILIHKHLPITRQYKKFINCTQVSSNSE